MKKVEKKDLVIKKEIISVLSERESEQVRGGDGDGEGEYSYTTHCLCISKRGDCCKVTTLDPIEGIYTTTAPKVDPYTYGPGCVSGTGQSQAQACITDSPITTTDYKISVNVCLTPTITEKDCYFPGI